MHELLTHLTHLQSEELRGTRGGIRYGNLSFEHTEHRAKRWA